MLQDFSWERYSPRTISIPTIAVRAATHKCPVSGCSGVYGSTEALAMHCARQHHDAFPGCQSCGKTFVSEVYLKAHIQLKHPNLFPCTRCYGLFYDQRSLVIHQWVAHPGFRCEPCDEFVYQEDMDHHLLTRPNHPVCRLCNIGFNDSGMLNNHMARVHRGLCCSICNIAFLTVDQLREHHKTTRKHYSCTHCNVGFSSEEFLKKHNSLMHHCNVTLISSVELAEDRSEIASISSSLTSSPVSRTVMIKPLTPAPTPCSLSPQKHSKAAKPPPIPASTIECKVCNQRFSQRKLAKHYYTSPKHPVCAPCEVGFEDELAYDDHVAKTHPPYYYPPPTPTSATSILPSLPGESINPTSHVHSGSSLTNAPTLPAHKPESDISPQPTLGGEASTTPHFTHHSNVFRSLPTSPSHAPREVSFSPATVQFPLSPEPTTPRSELSDLSGGSSRRSSFALDQRSEDGLSVSSDDTAVGSPLQLPKPQEFEHGNPDKPISLPPPFLEEKPITVDVLPEDHAPVDDSVALSIFCRLCLGPSSDPLVTMCGHVFCHSCIMAEISKNLQCPVCKKAMFVRLDMSGGGSLNV